MGKADQLMVRLHLLCTFLLVLPVIWAKIAHGGRNDPRKHGGVPRGRGGAFASNMTLPRSVTKSTTINEKDMFSILSMAVTHHGDVSWHVPSLHDKYSAGWNRTYVGPSMLRPYACNIRFFGMGLESTIENYMKGGTGYLTLEVPNGNKKPKWYGFDKEEKKKLHCYYHTAKGLGSEFVDNPKTLGMVVYCPVTLDVEIGEYEFRKLMEPGFFCRQIADNAVNAELYLRPSDFELAGEGVDMMAMAAAAGDDLTALNEAMDKAAQTVASKQISSHFTTSPMGQREQDIRLSEALDPRPHAICTVQTFRNAQSGPMLYAFVKYHVDLGWRVIVYDRFGLHKEYLKDLLHASGVDYHPFTVLQLVNPQKYNAEYAAKQGKDRKVFYKMEKNWGYKGEQADTADQDQDKTKTYDYARVEYAHVDLLLFLDADEFFFCPQAVSGGMESQRSFQQKQMQQFSTQGIEEMRFVRIPYMGILMPAPAGFNGTETELGELDHTAHTEKCMTDAWYAGSGDAAAASPHLVGNIMKCWSSASSYDNFPKSADLGQVCPFHYNHWSCDGMRNGGRDYVKTRCRCKVAFDMINGFEYKPVLEKCHLMHFNDNKYSFQSRREKHVNDHGNKKEPNPIYSKLLDATPPAASAAETTS